MSTAKNPQNPENDPQNGDNAEEITVDYTIGQNEVDEDLPEADRMNTDDSPADQPHDAVAPDEAPIAEETAHDHDTEVVDDLVDPKSTSTGGESDYHDDGATRAMPQVESTHTAAHPVIRPASSAHDDDDTKTKDLSDTRDEVPEFLRNDNDLNKTAVIDDRHQSQRDEDINSTTVMPVPAPTSTKHPAPAGKKSLADLRTHQPMTTDEQMQAQREALARSAARQDAIEGPKAVGRVMQVLLAIFAPIAVLIGIVRLVASPFFLWIEYHRPGFPADEFGWSLGERTTYGSYGLDYLFNFASQRYLSQLVQADDSPLFSSEEVSHMADVKAVMQTTMWVGIVAAIISLICIIVLFRTRKGGIRRGLFAGSLWLIIVLIVAAVMAITSWDGFFAGFHSLFFADGTWTFYTSDSLIRLYPGQFWMDAGITIAGLALIAAIVTLILTWPTKRRREDALQAQILLLSSKNRWEDTTETDEAWAEESVRDDELVGGSTAVPKR